MKHDILKGPVTERQTLANDPKPVREKPLVDLEWNPLKNSHVRIACVTARDLHHRMVGALFEAILYAQSQGVRVSLQFLQTSIVSQGRDRACTAAIEAEATHLLFVDSDVVIPKDTIPRLVFRDKDAVGGLYPNRHDNITVAFAMKSTELGGTGHTSFSWQVLNQPGLHPASAMGMGCTLIKTEALKRMKEYWQSLSERGRLIHRGPWFEYRTEDETTVIGEDIAFCEMAEEAGLELWIDSSILCQHIGETVYEFTPGEVGTTISVQKVPRKP